IGAYHCCTENQRGTRFDARASRGGIRARRHSQPDKLGRQRHLWLHRQYRRLGVGGLRVLCLLHRNGGRRELQLESYSVSARGRGLTQGSRSAEQKRNRRVPGESRMIVSRRSLGAVAATGLLAVGGARAAVL